jgi:uncharacterized Fe-S radical SAM superfamily protein PflX
LKKSGLRLPFTVYIFFHRLSSCYSGAYSLAKFFRSCYNVFMDWTKTLENCMLCPVECGADRLHGIGACGVSGLRIAKYYLHPFEEPSVSGNNGSGTVFFCGCALKCVFCQNYELSRNTRGIAISTTRLAEIFKELEDLGAHNINLVNPTHYSNKIIEAFKIYRPKIPVPDRRRAARYPQLPFRARWHR